MPDAANRGVRRQIDATQAQPQPFAALAWDRALERAVSAILSQLVDAFEERRHDLGLSVTDLVRQAHLSKRAVGLVKAGKVEASLRTLVAWAEACGLELDIRVRLKRTGKDQDAGRVEEAQPHGGCRPRGGSGLS